MDLELLGIKSALQTLATSPQLAVGDLAGFYRQASEALPTMGGGNIRLID